ncbi:hypothetical protein TIFTF001_039371 [Ficus carica]|uniref:Uncharacterized protein n=1 Tax=Ficus carica TaxID=3494 RepID=A0AA88JFS2_FICCA|nr:hypothetical protein TIFTF001_039371 [Ficus carica]
MLIAKQVVKCPQLSYQEMIDCFTPPIKSSFVDFYNDGASLVDACYFLRERGVLLEKYYPNEGIRPFNEIIRKRRDLDIPESAWTKPIKDFHLFVPETHDLNDPKVIQQICKALDEKPILMGFAIGDDFDESMTNSWCPSHISQSAAPAFHSIASEIAGRLLTYSIDATKGLCCRRSCTYLSRYVLRSAASPLVTAAGFLLLVEGHR